MNKKEKLEFAVKKADAFAKEYGNRKSTARYGMCSDRGFFAHSNTACHAGLSSPRGHGERNLAGDLTYVVDLLMDSSLDDKVRLAYIDFILNCPAYKGVLVHTDASKAIKDTYVMADAARPANHIASCLFSLRMASERSAMIQTWWDLTQLGIDQRVAYILCHSLRIKAGIVSIVSPENHHIGLNVSVMGRENVLNFMTGNLVGAKKKPYSEEHDYHSVEGLFGKDGNFHTVIKEFMADSMGGKEDNRPYLFYKRPEVGIKYLKFELNEELKKALLQFSKQLVEEAV